jgi:general L-amino acid transport system permease protein
LPQALRLVIPILVGQFISLFKDTSLVAIVGLFDLLGIAKTVLAQPEFLGLQREVYAFISLIYWILSYVMSYLSQRLEVTLGVGQR